MKRIVVAALLVGCRTSPSPRDAEALDDAAPPRASSEIAPVRPGMAYVPAGKLVVGTPVDRTPRVADEEPPGVVIEMSAYYIDLLPYPNEAGAIPTIAVSRDEAEQLCVAKGKRLCSELEWERACKGPENLPYEYGDTYRAPVCGAGLAIEEAARRPMGDRPQCRSGFGASDMHGGAWEWTSSTWRRGGRDASLGVLRGGNSTAGELASRCANAIGRPLAKKQATFGLRCCVGPRNAAEVELELKGTTGLVPTKVAAPVPGAIERAWSWTPVSNEELAILASCRPGSLCSVTVSRGATTLTKTDVGPQLPDVVRIGDARHLRYRGSDAKGGYSREMTYVFGRIELAEPRRP